MNPFRRPSVRYGKTPAPETPYQKAAQVWDDRIGAARVQARNWRLIAFGNLALAAGLAGGLVWHAMRGTVVPWVVQVDNLGQAQAVAPAIADYKPADGQIAWHLARFIEQVRSIPVDPIIVRQNWLTAYDFVTDRGALALSGHDGALDRHSHHHHRDPARRRQIEAQSARGVCSRPQLVEGARLMRSRSLLHIILCSLPVAGCANSWKPPRIGYDDIEPAVLQGEPPKPVEILELPKILPLPGQLKPLPGKTTAKPEPKDPKERVAKANDAARVQPTRHGYLNAVQVYPFVDGALYQVYTAPGEVTDIALQEGEQLVGSGPVAAGDTVRWVIGDTESGVGPTKRIHILAKPTRPDLTTNLVINTDRRTYLMELRSTEKTYMASVSWQYPQDQLIALRRQNEAADAAAPIDSGLDLGKLRFRYSIEGDAPPWRPTQVFDDGSKVYIEFSHGIRQGEMPPLFVIGNDGNAELVNYRARQNYYIVDRLFAAAELRLGGDSQQKVRIVRTDGWKLW